MQVILTHEQADFDAIAALLGARMLHESAAAILPRRTNRNVRAFLNLYGADLPFMDPRDIPAEPIESILLVDTQSLVTLKGTTSATKVRVIDHHAPKASLPEGWDVRIDHSGAATTLFVEAMQDAGTTLTPLQATLLLLGIYEDTGSLSYAGTTPRDVRAAAFVLEQGADLRIAARFLNPPLSPEQRQLYERLLASVEWHHIYGQNIVVACAPAMELNEEISSVAHKMRDLMDPDALFLLVATPDGIRLVARSTSDRVNVALISGEFGGGGHERAAAALIKWGPAGHASVSEIDQTLGYLRARLLEELPHMIQPSITVGQIMSRRPRLLSPKISAQEAAGLMQRYGYEGYPVVQDGAVIGLLTRRAVDRAISHRLNLPAVSLMDAGKVTVEPQQPVEHLQRVMSASGWGQVPVVDPHTGQIIGIVTRTDLLKILSPQSRETGRQNLSGRLEELLPPARLSLLKLVADRAHESHTPVFIVGGFVRDLILGVPGLDFDMVVEGDAIALAKSLAAHYGGNVTSHARFGTAKWDITSAAGLAVLPQDTDLPASLDLVSARTEFYEKPTALPTVERGSIKLDLHRRDFTINTLALRLDGRHYGELHDYWGGLNDLSSGLVRVLHSLSFIDDPTRMLRAVRFEQRFGFTIETRTLHLIGEARQLLRQISADRVRHELDLILAEEKAPAMLARLGELGLLDAIHPDLPASMHGDWCTKPDSTWQLAPKYSGYPLWRVLAYLLWLAPLGAEKARAVTRRLKVPRWMGSLVQDASQALPDMIDLVSARPSQVVHRLEELPPPVIYALYQLSENEAVRSMLRKYAASWRDLKPSINGETLRERGLPPGPIYRQVLQRLRDALLDGEINSAAGEEELLQKLLTAQPQEHS